LIELGSLGFGASDKELFDLAQRFGLTHPTTKIFDRQIWQNLNSFVIRR
jgi:hypothetical protein